MSDDLVDSGEACRSEPRCVRDDTTRAGDAGTSPIDRESGVVTYGATLFLSAFLLFVVQPMLGKRILPWFGGSSSVWTSCMLFFQVLLLGGYAYAHFLTGRRSAQKQAVIHILLLAGSLATLPALTLGMWKTAGESWPVPRILETLAFVVGVPYFMLASASPLLQAWFSRSRRGTSPYRLYSLSNAGSLLAIIAYPFVIEPALSLGNQVRFWSWGYAAFAVVSAAFAWEYIRSADAAPVGPAVSDWTPAPPFATEEPGRLRRILWLLLPACSSLMLLATTNQLCLDVAVIPLLWILPLGLYLLSFILCFHSPRWYSRIFFGVLFAAALAWTCVVLFEDVFASLMVQIASCSFVLFTACMICHGELARSKPGACHLTEFYAAIAAGGVLGGVVVTFLAPVIFKGYWEYHFGLLATALLFLMVFFFDRESGLYHGKPLVAWILLCSAAGVLALTLGRYLQQATAGNIEMCRNFFGVLRVIDEDKGDPRYHRYTLMHGRIQHGFQYQSSFRRNWPTTYYGPGSGVGLALRYHPKRAQDPSKSLRIGVVGLGTGTLASYGLQGDYIRFYEINPEVVRLARQYFTFLKNCSARVEIVPGDARISMVQEKERGEFGQFDVLAIDAFSGDAIPVHLLTRECMEIYRAHLKPDGILALHVSSRYFDLVPVARGLADWQPEQGARAVLISCPSTLSEGINASDWVLATANQEFLNAEEVRQAVRPWQDQRLPPQLWTDDYSNLFRLLRRKEK